MKKSEEENVYNKGKCGKLILRQLLSIFSALHKPHYGLWVLAIVWTLYLICLRFLNHLLFDSPVGLQETHKNFSRGWQRDDVYLVGLPIEPSYMSPNAGGWGGMPSQWVQLCTWRPNKLWRSNSIFNLFPIAQRRVDPGELGRSSNWRTNLAIPHTPRYRSEIDSGQLIVRFGSFELRSCFKLMEGVRGPAHPT